jgi:hypothetical protein
VERENGEHDPEMKAPERARRARIASIAALAAALACPALLAVAWSRPVAAPPLEMPALALDSAAVRAQLERDESDARRDPRGEQAELRRRLYREHNTAEHEGFDAAGRGAERAGEIAAALEVIRTEAGARAIERMRAADVARAELALRGAIPAGEAVEELGVFREMMARYGLSDGRRQRAPRFVVRTVLKARWNTVHALELDESFSRIERQAYWGWLALRAETAPADRRLLALERYADAGGRAADEARAVLFYDAGELEQARASFEAAYQKTPNFRLRNHALACAED